MIVHDTTVQRIFNHLIINLVHSTSNGLYEPSATNHCIKFQRNIGALQFVEYQLATEILLLGNGVKRCQFFCGMGDVAKQNRLLIFVDSHLSGCRTRINYQYFHRHAKAKMILLNLASALSPREGTTTGHCVPHKIPAVRA